VEDDDNWKIPASILAQPHLKKDPFESNDSFEIMVTTFSVANELKSWTFL